MNSRKMKSIVETKCMKCGREIPAGMYYREISEKGIYVGDLCYTVCKPKKDEVLETDQEVIDVKKLPISTLLMGLHPDGLSTPAAKAILHEELQRRIDNVCRATEALKKELEGG